MEERNRARETKHDGVALRNWRDRARQVLAFEAGGLLLITPPFSWASGAPVLDSLGLLALLALIAALWNACYNTVFDRLEAHFLRRRADLRPPLWRVAHALGFEGGLLFLTLPVIVAWTGMGWLEALVADLGLALAYTVYAYVFNWGYDRLFPIGPEQGE
ncbi:MAG: PACE efflux transporter [Rhodocyclales bacterium]|nr:PACE efflux transporter [Rhodocyclales bacterium]